MSKSVKSLFGTSKFNATSRKIDEDAFKIEKSKEASDRSDALGAKAEQRSDKAAQDRSGLITQLQGQADGTAPSLAEAQLRSATDRNLAQQLAVAQSQRGGSAASRQREVLRGQATAGRDIAQQSAELRIQERNQAQQLLGQQISDEQQLSDQLTQQYLQQGFTIEQARQQAAADFERLQTEQHLAIQGINASAHSAANAGRAGITQGIIGGLSSVASSAASAGAAPAAGSTSDENAKTKIKKATSKDFLDKLEAFTYEYKKSHKNRPTAGEGSHLSVMAQDLEKAGPVGKSMVSEDETGTKQVDYAKGYGAILAAQSYLNKRLNELESKKIKKSKKSKK